MRRSIATISVVVLGLALTQGTAHAAPVAKPATKNLPAGKPAGANPFLADLPAGAKVDYKAWSKYLKSQNAAKAKARLETLKAQKSPALTTVTAAPVVVDEDEPDGTSGSNDTVATAQEIDVFGTAAKKAPKIRILGSLDNEAVAVDAIDPSTEDDGDINKAADTGVNGDRQGASTTGTIGDGPFGSDGTGSGDYDYYQVSADAGQAITIQTGGTLDTTVTLYDAQGNVVAYNDDIAFPNVSSRVVYRSAAGGTYFAAVAGFGADPVDPFDSSVGFGAGSEGPYSVTFTAGAVDSDVYGVKLRAGDVLGASITGSASELDIYDSTGRLVHGSQQDASSIYPMASPLPGGGNAVNDYVATTTGWYYIGAATGSGGYDITVEGYRPVLQGAKPTQTLFLDFDGARVNTGVFGGTGNVNLSPFSAFVAKWGLTNADRNKLIDAVTAGVTENIKQDMLEKGLNPRFKLKVTNSKDNPDTWGQPNVSRIIVGGTIAESGVPTIGIAQSIDPGNFETQETALVLLDELSNPSGPEDSLNTYITPASDKIAFIGHALGNVIAHEAGHYFGNFHTDNEDAQVNVMDAGGTGFANLFGVGPDGVGGTADDPDVDFGEDQFIPAEGFTGIEDTLGRIDFGVTS
jgi:hypothetical protein